MSWELLSGCVEEYFNQQLLDLGRYRFHRDNGTGPEHCTPVAPEATVFRLAADTGITRLPQLIANGGDSQDRSHGKLSDLRLREWS